MTRKELNQKHWKYYLMLEKQFIETLEFVELDVSNFKTFSNMYALLVQAIGSELDAIFKEFCGFSTDDRKNIADYATEIIPKNPNIKSIKLSIIGYDNILQPFEKWNNDKPSQSLSWWNSFTDIKHNRYNKRKEANLENTLSILGALYIINMLLLKKVVENTEEFDVHDEPSRLFQLENLETKFISLGGACIVEI